MPSWVFPNVTAIVSGLFPKTKRPSAEMIPCSQGFQSRSIGPWIVVKFHYAHVEVHGAMAR
jgi:hypothetical protein